jgi:hypothetical protein
VGDWPRLVNLRRCARGRIVDSGEDTNTTIALTNNSAAAELLLVWQFAEDETDNNGGQFSYQQIQPMGSVGVVQSVVPGDAVPPGILTSGDQATLFTPDFAPVPLENGNYWPATFPFAVLLPGWSLVVQPVGGGTGGLGISFWWEAILSKYFDRMHSALCVELELQEDSES